MKKNKKDTIKITQFLKLGSVTQLTMGTRVSVLNSMVEYHAVNKNGMT
jgi:hypothetical protein